MTVAVVEVTGVQPRTQVALGEEVADRLRESAVELHDAGTVLTGCGSGGGGTLRPVHRPCSRLGHIPAERPVELGRPGGFE